MDPSELVIEYAHIRYLKSPPNSMLYSTTLRFPKSLSLPVVGPTKSIHFVQIPSERQLLGDRQHGAIQSKRHRHTPHG